MNIHNVMADIAADILRPVALPICRGCNSNLATAYATWHRIVDGQVTDAGGAYLCSSCRDGLESMGAVVRGEK